MVNKFPYYGVLVFLFSLVNAQSSQQLFFTTLKQMQQDLTTQQLSIEENQKAGQAFWQKGGIAQLGYLFLRTYQSIISSQDMPSCNFYPSCSHFAQDALTHAPFPLNLLLISDRLQRCNGMPGKERFYPFDPQKGRFRDPITNYVNRPKRP